MWLSVQTVQNSSPRGTSAILLRPYCSSSRRGMTLVVALRRRTPAAFSSPRVFMRVQRVRKDHDRPSQMFLLSGSPLGSTCLLSAVRPCRTSSYAVSPSPSGWSARGLGFTDVVEGSVCCPCLGDNDPSEDQEQIYRKGQASVTSIMEPVSR